MVFLSRIRERDVVVLFSEEMDKEKVSFDEANWTVQIAQTKHSEDSSDIN